MTRTFPSAYADLQPFADWALATANERYYKRLSSTREELKAVYDAVSPRIEDIMKLCDEHKLGALPADLQPLFNLALSMAEISHHIELYRGSVGVPYAFDETRFIAVHGNQETWQAKPPSGLAK